jgi:hypothetical protein
MAFGRTAAERPVPSSPAIAFVAEPRLAVEARSIVVAAVERRPLIQLSSSPAALVHLAAGARHRRRRTSWRPRRPPARRSRGRRIDHRPERQHDRHPRLSGSARIVGRASAPPSGRAPGRSARPHSPIRSAHRPGTEAGGGSRRRTSTPAASSPSSRWVSTLALIPGQIGANVAEPLRPEHQLAHHQQSPALADQVERVGGPQASS